MIICYNEGDGHPTIVSAGDPKIENADLVILGPGSFLTSVIPPLLVRDISNALLKSDAHCIFIDNIVPEQSPAAHLTIDEKLEWIEENIGSQPIECVICQDKDVTSNKVDIICTDLANQEIKHHHDEAKLANQ